MFEVLTHTYNGFKWIVHHILKDESETRQSLQDPGIFLSGALAGGFARGGVLVIDRGGLKGATQAVGRRTLQLGILMMFYISPASHMLPDLEDTPFIKMATTFLVAACAGFHMRFICNPISRVMDESLRTGMPWHQVMRMLYNKTILQFWYVGPNFFANAFYYGTLLTVFEGLRRFSERNNFPLPKDGYPLQAITASSTEDHSQVGFSSTFFSNTFHLQYSSYIYMRTAATNFFIGGVSAAVASTFCYPYSAHRYLQTVIHDSAICRGLGSTLAKEVPMMAIFFGTFSLLQPILVPHHGIRCGFGY
ncbi:unnamed protein product [Phytomonas sp. Hart1]|nr:unnamed protein product [Phytomonas sp. Hart1]|eukprot:CCW68091.1 unnamed protein product [Phytomonas sp. isolate Hart1]